MGAEQKQDAAKRRAVFLDRDGTISEEYGYANHISRFQMFPFAAAAIRRLNEAGIPVIVVTNQSGVARGYFGEELVARIHARMSDELAAAGARVDGVYYCPHVRADGCKCRKPEVGMLKQAAREHNLQLGGSTVVGDRYSDVALGHAAGCRSIFVLTGYGRGDYEWHHASWPRQPDDVVENLAEAVDLILKDCL
jgi:D-glycero-D-manno-heptose 1,7-bisphosphate phosphatase